MNEAKLIEQTPTPWTRESIMHDLRQLGLDKGMTVIIHSSLSLLGWVCGGLVVVIQALMDIITSSGTIVMPTQSIDYSHPALWSNPLVPIENGQRVWKTYRDIEVNADVFPEIGAEFEKYEKANKGLLFKASGLKPSSFRRATFSVDII